MERLMLKALKDMFLFPLFAIFFVVLLFLGLDQYCKVDANKRLPYYPGSERVKEVHNGLRIRGVGNTLETFSSQDSKETVDAWYKEHTLKLVQQGKTRGVANLNYEIQPNPEGSGVLIHYLSQCVM
jgi:hypothetical protein